MVATHSKFARELEELDGALRSARRVLITAPAVADGDSIGAQLALRRLILSRYPKLSVFIVNGDELPPRYRVLPEVEYAFTPEQMEKRGEKLQFDVGILVDGGIDRTGSVQRCFEACPTRVFIDHHAISADYNYTIKFVEPTASSTTELIYNLSQTPPFKVNLDPIFAQQIYLGIVFDTGFFRHSNTTPEVMELAAKLLRTGFDFTALGERGMLERTYESLMLMTDTLSQAELRGNGKIIWSFITQAKLREYKAHEDDREGIIDQLFLTHGIEVAVLFIELKNGTSKISFRSHGGFDVAAFARSLTEHGGGHKRAAGANLEKGLDHTIKWVLEKLEANFR